jgi:hypothetical protein
LRRLLGEREPAFAELLRAAEWQLDRELSRGVRREAAHPCGRRHIMNTARLYHLDSSVCVDHWSCAEQEHTSVPPRCGDQAADRAAGCELPKGHPGPHVHGVDRKRRATSDAGTTAATAATAAAVATAAKSTATGEHGHALHPSPEL